MNGITAAESLLGLILPMEKIGHSQVTPIEKLTWEINQQLL
jgi:hypothetical protein